MSTITDPATQEPDLPAGASRPARPGRLRPRSRLGRAVAVPVLAVAVAAVATGAAGTVTIRVHQGDTLWGLARSHHTTVAELRSLNHIPGSSSLIVAGQLLQVPGNASPGVRPIHHTARPAARQRVVDYVVHPGDNVTTIAQHFGVSTVSLVRANHIGANGLILIGQHLRVVVPVRAAAHPVVRHYPAATVRAAAHHRAQLAARSVPSRASVRAMIVRTARQYGVDPALALAVSYQESGFNQHVVSDADAIGAMQVLPSTGDYLSRYVVHRRLDLLDARDNVTAGVALLKQLTSAAATPQAVAGYYQGLGSVQQHGMFADTRDYVASVLALRDRFRG